jgi:hypothetical protein
MTYTDITKLENCPECGANWVDKLIPQEYWENYSPPYFYSRMQKNIRMLMSSI